MKLGFLKILVGCKLFGSRRQHILVRAMPGACGHLIELEVAGMVASRDQALRFGLVRRDSEVMVWPSSLPIKLPEEVLEASWRLAKFLGEVWSILEMPETS